MDRLGLQSTSAFHTKNKFHNQCCDEAHKQNFFAQVQGGGIVVCCNGQKVPCALEHDASKLPGAAKLAYKLSLNCLIEHEQQHVADLPNCPPCPPGTKLHVELASFPDAKARSASECSSADVEISCLEKSKNKCAGDKTCIQLLENFKAGPTGLKTAHGCP